MKLTKTELILAGGLLIALLIVLYSSVIYRPATDELFKAQQEYRDLSAQQEENKHIIDKVAALTSTRDDLKNEIATIENSLLPELDVEVITSRFADIFAANNLEFVTKITSTMPTSIMLQRADGTTSGDSVQYIRISMKVSGKDGVTEGGIPASGYEDFIKAVKTIETENPEAIRIYSISMEETQQGFQYFFISVDVYQFVLSSERIDPIDTSDPYLSWYREAVATGGKIGIPYDNVPPSKLLEVFFRPFATTQVSGGVPDAGDAAQVPDATEAAPTPAA